MIQQLIEQWWFWPMLAALILISIHTYLGMHVITRKVLFVDLALAQIAALGTSVAFLYDFELHDSVTYYVSLLFAIVGAWVFSITRTRGERVPQEAIIGLSFAIASAGSILLSTNNPHGAEHLRDILQGSILTVKPRDVENAAILYGVVGAVHWIFRKRFLLISTDPDAARQAGTHVRLWDFLFYVTFALVITLSVRIAGVLLVFCLLIAPAVCGALFATDFRTRLFIGWGASVASAVGGLLFSGYKDWPPAPAIICIYAVLLIAVGLTGHIAHSPRPAQSMLKAGAATAGLLLGTFALISFLRSDFAHSGRKDHGDDHTHGKAEHPLGSSRHDLLLALKDEHDKVRADAAKKLGEMKDPAVIPDLIQALKDLSPAVKERAAEALGRIGRPEAAEALSAALDVKDEDEWVNLREAEALVRCGGVKGMSVLITMAAEADAKLVRIEALKKAAAFAGRPALKSPEGPEGKTALQELKSWWEGAKGKVHWDAASMRFIVPN